jgi:exodeoxyribonuclease VIII
MTMTNFESHPMATDVFPFTDVSIDIETLGHKYNAPILSIGAVAFNRDTGKLGKTFYQEIEPDSAIKVGTPTASTIAWWITQSKAAQRIFNDSAVARENKMHIASALLNFVTYVRSLGTPRPWGNGATFDVTIIEHSIDMGTVGLAPPWVYWNIRDIRTLVDTAETLFGWKKDSVAREGVHHNALDDAVHQAKLVIGAWAAIGGKKAPVFAKSAKPAVTKVVDDDDEL